MVAAIQQDEGKASQAKGTSGLTFGGTKEGLEHRVFRVGHRAKNGKITLEHIMEGLHGQLLLILPFAWLELQHTAMSLGHNISPSLFACFQTLTVDSNTSSQPLNLTRSSSMSQHLMPVLTYLRSTQYQHLPLLKFFLIAAGYVSQNPLPSTFPGQTLSLTETWRKERPLFCKGRFGQML